MIVSEEAEPKVDDKRITDGAFAPARILIVDDEFAIAAILKEIVELSGYECLAVCSARDALESTMNFQPDLVISDMLMPGMNGFELEAELRTRYPQLPMILLSGALAKTHLEGADRPTIVLSKPCAPRELLRVAAEMIQQRRQIT